MKQETYRVQLRRYLIRVRPVHTTEKIHPRLTDVERAAGEFPEIEPPKRIVTGEI